MRDGRIRSTLVVTAACWLAGSCGGTTTGTDGLPWDGGTGGVAGGEPVCLTGTHGCPCYGNGTCNNGLSCVSNRCELAGPTAGGGTSSGGTGATGVTGGPTGGIGGSGGGSQLCASRVVIDAGSPLITDFEGLLLNPDFGLSFQLSEASVFAGTYSYADSTVHPENQIYAFVDGPSSATALSTSFIDSSEWGGGVGFWIDSCLDASAMSGISFWARGWAAGPLTFAIGTPGTVTLEYGGSCPDEGPCVSPSVPITLTEAWTEYRIAWGDVSPGDAAGTPVPTNGAEIIRLEWLLPGPQGTPATLELVLDDVTFF